MKITTYAEMEKYALFAAQGKTASAMFLSRGGLGKTQTIKSILAKHKIPHVYKSGFMTVTELVRLFYEHPDDLIVIDDVDALFESERTFAILRQACDTVGNRTVQYASPSHTVADIPKEFPVQATVILLVNDFPDSPAIKAFKTRTICVEFQPSGKEVSERLCQIATSGKISHDPEVLSQFQKLAPVSKMPNFRAYILSAALKTAGMDWQKHLADAMGADPLITAALQSVKHGKTYQDHTQHFQELTGKSARTYSRIISEYKSLR